MNKKTAIIISSTGIVVVLLALIGFTYGFFMSIVSGNESAKKVKLTAGESKLEYTDLSEEHVEEIIYPGYVNTKFFAVQNIGSLSASYFIHLVEVENTFNRPEDIIYTIYRKKGDTNILPEDFDTNVTDFSDWENITLNQEECPNVSEYSTISCQYPITNGLLKNTKETIENPNDYYVYAMQTTYINQPDVDQIVDETSIFGGIIKIYADVSGTDIVPFDEGTLAYNVYLNALYYRNETELTGGPLSGVAVVSSGDTFNTKKTESTVNVDSIASDKSVHYWTYADAYTLNEKTGLSLTNPKICKYSECYAEMEGKYIVALPSGNVGYANRSYRSTSGLTTIYQIVTAGTSATSGITLKKISIPSAKIQVTEQILTTAEDDHGTSFYFRGNVKDNYVNFAGMCWRIVRISGDKSVKLILEDANFECNHESYTGNFSIGTGVYGYTTDSYNNVITNYMNSSESGMKDAFLNFQTTLESKLQTIDSTKNLANTLKSGDWCYDTSTYSDNAGFVSVDDLTTFYANTKGFHYGAYVRLMNRKYATLKCSVETLNNFDDSTLMYIGTITADEAAYAGDIRTTATQKHYLMNDYMMENSIKWWTLSPVYYTKGIEGAYCLDLATSKICNVNLDTLHYRPAISLLSTTQYVSGNGTKEYPYEVG